jgi:hypothetical protein
MILRLFARMPPRQILRLSAPLGKGEPEFWHI